MSTAAAQPTTSGHSSASRSLHRRRLTRGLVVAAILTYLTVLLIAPLIGIVLTVFRSGVDTIVETLSLPDVRHAFFLTAIIAVVTVVVTTVFGVIVSWVLTRQRFRGRSLLNALVDLPFAISPVTVGLMAVLLFGRGGWFEPFFASRGIQVLFALPSMIIVTIFIAIPFVVREVAPILEEVGTEEEDAARTLGASSWASFRKVTLPNIRWGLLYGIALTTARSIGEIGAVLIVSGQITGKTETATIYVLAAYEERLDAQGNVVALCLAGISILLLVAIEFAKRRRDRLKERA